MTPNPVVPPQAQADRVVRLTRLLALSSVIGLIVLGLGWELWWAPTGSGTLALKVLPLLLPLPGLLRHRMYTYRWLSLLVWLYFMEGAVRVTTESGLSQWLAGLEVKEKGDAPPAPRYCARRCDPSDHGGAGCTRGARPQLV